MRRRDSPDGHLPVPFVEHHAALNPSFNAVAVEWTRFR